MYSWSLQLERQLFQRPIKSVYFDNVLYLQSYSLVAVAAVIAGNCRVPLTAILLLFELTHDYTILLPTLGAVGLSYWVSVVLDPAASKAAGPMSTSSSSQDEGSATDSPSGSIDTTRCGPCM